MATSKAVLPPALAVAEAVNTCRRPFTAAAVKWKIQANPKADDKPATIVAFIDARLAGERLNYAGLLWSSKFADLASGAVECELSVYDMESGTTVVRRSDVGYAENARDKGMELKSKRSDAFKRAAVHFGVGVSIYALPLKRLYAKDEHIKKLGNSWVITFKGQDALAKHYAEWLEKIGIPQFGEPVDHGDTDGAQGDVESSDRASDESVAKDTPTPAPEKPKAEEKPAPAEPVSEEPTGKKGADVILERYAQSGKTIDDVKTYLTSRGVEDTDGLTGTLAEAGTFLEALPKSIGIGVAKWLKNSAAKREREAAEAAGE